MNLREFVDDWNSEDSTPFKLMKKYLPELVQELVDNLDAFMDSEDKPENSYLRLSSIGYPLHILALKKLMKEGVLPYKRRQSHSMSMTVYFGHFFETLIFYLLKCKGFQVTGRQEELSVDVNGVEVVGHIDGIVNGNTLIDVKTMSWTYFNAFVKRPDNDRGYISQLAAYNYELRLPKLAFLCLNKATMKLALIELLPELLERHFEEDIPRKIEYVSQVESLEDFYELEPPPPLVYRGGKFDTSSEYSVYSDYHKFLYGNPPNTNDYRRLWRLV